MEMQGPVPGMPGAIFRRVAKLPEQLPDGKPAGPHTQARPGHLLSVIRGVGSFSARDGSLIEFSHEENADRGQVMLLLNGTARGALIHQRGELPLHACTLVPPGGDRAVAICGPSGAGKSTLGAELSRRGWTLVADDTTRVTWNGTHVVAWPSRDSIKLWKDACQTAGIGIAGLERVAASIEKYYVRVKARDQPIELDTIVELAAGNDTRPLSAGDKMALVSRNTYRPAQIRPLGTQKEHVRIVAQTTAACTILRLPGGRALSVAALADALETALG